MIDRAPTVYGGDPAAAVLKACEAIQNIAHGNVERFLRVAPLDGYGCYTGDVVTGFGFASANPASFTSLHYNGRVPVGSGTYQTPYGSTYGVNVATGDIDGGGKSEVLTGPGPGASNGPQVRAWEGVGTPSAGSASISKVNFFAYGTLKYGVNVTSGDIDGDGYDEILTGPGPGSAFTPNVKGFNYDNGTLTAMAKVNFFAWPSGNFGANVSGGNLDGDAYDEIYVGRGPGSAIATDAKFFDFDNNAIAEKTTYALTSAYGNLKYGLRVAASDFDNTGNVDLATGLGPGGNSSFTPILKAWHNQNPGWSQVALTTAFPSGNYGAFVGSGHLPVNCLFPPCNRIIAGNGQDPAVRNQGALFSYTGGTTLNHLIGSDFYVGTSNRFGGATVAGTPYGSPLDDGATNLRANRAVVSAYTKHYEFQGGEDILTALQLTRDLLADTPDSQTDDPMLAPRPPLDINVWTDDALKASAVSHFDYVLSNWNDLTSNEITSVLAAARGDVDTGLENEFARDEILGTLDDAIAAVGQQTP